ncbi:hypothetical protein A2U01_0072097, partial [Trifolium medium]|nr:hypothetical protein [Trifolium medium]
MAGLGFPDIQAQSYHETE